MLDISDPTSLKEVLSTSHPGTGNGADTEPDLTIGEEVTYRLTFTFPEGITTNVRIVDLLPIASAASPVTLEYVSHALVSFGANLTPAVLPAPVVNDRDADGSNDRVIWTLGTITNAPDNTINGADRIIIDVSARVRNLPDNIGLITNRDLDLVNTSRITYTIGGVDTTVEGSATVDLAEPQLQIGKAVNPIATVDAGQLLTYTLTISHTGQSTANAYDVSIADTMPTVFSAPAFVPATSTCDERTAWALSFTAPTATYSFDNLLLGESCTIVYDGRAGYGGGEWRVPEYSDLDL
ncbi:MAG: hypothetical protein IPK52_22115 [Chloroflexi bacterium]|nr:hypothetical protein [Chloroflexota bacterium]